MKVVQFSKGQLVYDDSVFLYSKIYFQFILTVPFLSSIHMPRQTQCDEQLWIIYLLLFFLFAPTIENLPRCCCFYKRISMTSSICWQLENTLISSHILKTMSRIRELCEASPILGPIFAVLFGVSCGSLFLGFTKYDSCPLELLLPQGLLAFGSITAICSIMFLILVS